MPCPLSPMEPGQTAPSVPAPLRCDWRQWYSPSKSQLPLAPPMLFRKKKQGFRCSQPGQAPRKVAFIELATATSSKRPVTILIPQNKGQFMTRRRNSTESARQPEKHMSPRKMLPRGDVSWQEPKSIRVSRLCLVEFDPKMAATGCTMSWASLSYNRIKWKSNEESKNKSTNGRLGRSEGQEVTRSFKNRATETFLNRLKHSCPHGQRPGCRPWQHWRHQPFPPLTHSVGKKRKGIRHVIFPYIVYCVHIYIYIYMCVCVFINTCIYIYVCVCVCALSIYISYGG